jgi:type IV pilus assembly protein PilO
MALELNLNAIKALPAYQKALMGGILVVAVVVLFFVFIAKPKIDEMKTLEQQIAQINNEIQINQAKVRRLDELKRENAELAHQLAVLKEQLRRV